MIVEVNNLGYKIFVSPSFWVELSSGAEFEIYTHQHVREDALDLYGLKSAEELQMFELLLSVSGIGPKSALGVLAIASPADIKISINQGDPSLLTKVSGIGRKTAERVVLELRGKIKTGEAGAGAGAGQNNLAKSEEIDALTALGYSLAQAREALDQVNPEVKDSGERIREALKQMQK